MGARQRSQAQAGWTRRLGKSGAQGSAGIRFQTVGWGLAKGAGSKWQGRNDGKTECRGTLSITKVQQAGHGLGTTARSRGSGLLEACWRNTCIGIHRQVLGLALEILFHLGSTPLQWGMTGRVNFLHHPIISVKTLWKFLGSWVSLYSGHLALHLS